MFLPFLISMIMLSVNYSAKSIQAFHEPVSNSVSDAAGKGTITCMMDGKQRTFSPHQGFFEIRLDPDSKGPTDAIEILDGNNKIEGFQFEFKKTGTTQIGHGGDMNCIINYYNPQGIVYIGKPATVTVVSYDKKNLTATFQGKLVNAHYQKGSEQYPDTIQITDGKIVL